MNVAHPDCKIRTLAQQAKDRLANGKYCSSWAVGFNAPHTLTPLEEHLYKKILDKTKDGKEIENPIRELCDMDYFNSLGSLEKQKYVLEISAAYLSLKNKVF